DAENLAGRRLLVQRLGEIAVPDLEFLEQTHVLDGDDRLVGEGPEQLDLLVREWPHLASSYEDDAAGRTFAEERRGQERATGGDAGARRGGEGVGVFRRGRRREALEVARPPVTARAPGHRAAARGDGRADPQGCSRLWPVSRYQPEGLAFQAQDGGRGRAADQGGILSHDVHHGLEIGRRAGDDSQNLARRPLPLLRLLKLA